MVASIVHSETRLGDEVSTHHQRARGKQYRHMYQRRTRTGARRATHEQRLGNEHQARTASGATNGDHAPHNDHRHRDMRGERLRNS